jgi:hypothetical protein
MMRRLAAFGAVLLALAVLYFAAAQTRPQAGAAASVSQASTTTAVTSVTRTCPPPDPGTGVARIAVVAVPGPGAGSQGTGTARLSAVPSATSTTSPAKASAGLATAPAKASPAASTAGGATPSAAPVTLSTPGALTLQVAPQATQYGSTAVSATGTMAQGFEAEEATASGVGTVSCTHPGSDMWFVGTGEQAGAPAARLYLMNTGAVAANVEVTLITDAGIQQGLSTAIPVGPGQYLLVDLAQYAHGSVVMAVHVQTSSGQVAAAVWQGPSSGSGGTWLPQAAEPATRLVIPGLTAASSAARLFVVVPGPDDAKVKVVALTAHGLFEPFGPAPEDAPAAASSSLALQPLGASAAALVLTSNVPITAAIAVPGSGIGSFSAAAAPVTGQGVVAGNPGGKQYSAGLVLSAPDGPATATISVIPGQASAGPSSQAAPGQAAPAPQVVHVPSGDTVAVTVQHPAGGQPFAIVVTPDPGSGPLYAARVVTSGGSLSGPVMSILPVPSAPTEVVLPPTRDSYTAIAP